MRTRLLKKIRREVENKIIVLKTNKGYTISFYGVLYEREIPIFDLAVLTCKYCRRKKMEEIMMYYKAKKYQKRFKVVF